MVRDPIWQILRDQGRNMSWLARQTGYKHGTVRRISCGYLKPSAAFRRKCAIAMSMSERYLFVSNLDGPEINAKVEGRERELSRAG